MDDHRFGEGVITSSNNPHVKLMRSLGRRKSRQARRAFLVEGKRLVDDAIAAGVEIRSLLVREDTDLDWVESQSIPQERIHLVGAAVFDQSSDVEHSQGIAAVASMPAPMMPAESRWLSDGSLLVLDQIRDPGNLGTLLRSAAASGTRTVLYTSGSVDPYSPKVVRAGMGAHFRLCLGHLTGAWTSVIAASSMAVILADMSGATTYDAVNWSQPFVLVVGGETEALSPALAPLVTTAVRIPMVQGVESLNAAVAGSIVLFEAMRQRRYTSSIG